MDACGFATKAKDRLVARGDMEREFVDFADLYAPTVATSSVRLLAAFTNEYDLELCNFDVDQTFVRADLKEDVFLTWPEGCELPRSIQTSGSRRVITPAGSF